MTKIKTLSIILGSTQTEVQQEVLEFDGEQWTLAGTPMFNCWR